MSASFRIKSALWDKIHYFASFPQTGVSLQQMVLFGQNPSQGTLLRASQFLAEELPVRLAHRVKELDELPHNLSEMSSIKKVKNWYAQSFEELINFPPVVLPDHVRQAILSQRQDDTTLPESTPNPSNDEDDSPYPYPHHFQSQLRARQQKSSSQSSASASSAAYTFSHPSSSKLRLRVPMERRYYSRTDLSTYPPEVYDFNSRFTKLLHLVKTRHDPTVTTVAQGVLEWKRLMGAQNIDLDIQAWLDRFYMSRIGIRFLIGQHVALNTHQCHDDYVGIICTQANVHDIVQESIENARFVCEEHYAMFKGPPVQLICPRNLTFAYVPGHLSHIVFELLKNSLRAVVERHGVESEEHFPPIKVVVVEGKEDITIKISDEGGGIPRSAIPLIWTYMYTTMNNLQVDQDYASDFKAPMAGFGYGLPLSRLYARYFGGDLKLISMDGFGTDVYIHLNRLSSSREPLP
ncbi:mitochondrial branched-chain alpha-ketoacid dehydrogenase kinase-domain-containing protein [Amanita rubescens]|nr:mitochondrial branched-chain alpha-ketoacid dehydrogenase kinase-domain-containing protein [Amanita rubescens]KAF8333262.1 mitochondrial branched-chain alpha-ketoacid dehydrogenase kinase-domain-containing protein [Amanita rubescens]